MHTFNFSKLFKKVVSHCPQNSEGGFTLIETVITLSLMVAFSTILVGYSQSSRDQFTSIDAHTKTLSIFSRAKLLSTSAFLERGEQSKINENLQICGFGVHVDYEKNTAFIFRDVAENCKTDANNVYDEGEQLGGELNGVVLDKILLHFVGTAENRLNDVVFIPPDPTVMINNDDKIKSARVEIQSRNERLENTIITVSAAGQITTK
jgi:hypothetical protein